MSLILDEIKITAIAGPPFVAIILNWGLFGVLSIQVYNAYFSPDLYSQAFQNDKAWLKVLVWVVYFLEMTQTFLLTDTAWKMLVSGFGNIEAADEVGTTWLSICGIGGLVGFLVRWFYAYRLVVILRKWRVPAGIIFMSLISFSGVIATAIICKQTEKFSMLLLDKQRTFILFGVWGGPGSVCDVMIAVSMCYYLYKRRSNSPGRFSQTDALIKKLTRVTIETGVLTGTYLSCLAILISDLTEFITATTSTLTLALYYPHKFQTLSYFQVPSSLDAKLYSTTMMVMLNSRLKLGVVSKSTTWRDNELIMAPGQDSNCVELNMLSADGSLKNTDILVTKEEITIRDDPKIQCIAPLTY